MAIKPYGSLVPKQQETTIKPVGSLAPKPVEPMFSAKSTGSGAYLDADGKIQFSNIEKPKIDTSLTISKTGTKPTQDFQKKAEVAYYGLPQSKKPKIDTSLTISQGKPTDQNDDWYDTGTNKIREVTKNIPLLKNVSEILFGVGKEKYTKITGERPAVTSGFGSDISLSDQVMQKGLIGALGVDFLTRTKQEKIELANRQLIKDGATEEQAFKISTQWAMSDEKGKELLKNTLPISLKKSLERRETYEGLGVLTDVLGLGILPIGKLVKGGTTSLKVFLKGADDVAEVSKALKQAGFAEDLITEYAPFFKEAKTIEQVEKGLDALNKVSEATAKKSFIEDFNKTYNSGPSKIKTETSLDKANETRKLAQERRDYIKSKAGELKSYSSEDIAKYNEKVLKAGEEFDKTKKAPSVSLETKTGGLSQDIDKAIAKYPNDLNKATEEFVKAQGTPVYHGGKKVLSPEDFRDAIKSTYADERGALFTSSDKQVTGMFGKETTELYPQLKNPLVIDAKKNNYYEIPIPKELRKDFHSSMKTADTDSLVEIAQERGHDGVIIKNVIEGAGEYDPSDARNVIIGLKKDSFKTKSQLQDLVKQRFNETKKASAEAISQSTRSTGQAGVQDVASKNLSLPSEKATQKSVLKTPQKDILSKPVSSLPAKYDEVFDPLSKSYKETAEKSIVDTAKKIKEPVPIVRRVVESLKKTKTNFLEYFQNEQETVRKLLQKKDLKITDTSDPYLKATLYSGRVSEKIEQGRKEAQDIISEIKKLADSTKSDLISVRKEVNDYLQFRHAPERNLALGEKAAGITTKEATEGLKALENSTRGKQIKELANRIQTLSNKTLDTLKEGGVITDELYDTLRNKYKNHVPLQRIFEETEDVGAMLSGRGFDVKSTGIKKAVGSEREVDDILANVISNYEQAILRSEKNIVDNATLNFVRNNKEILGDLFEIIKPKAVGRTFKGIPILEKTTDPTILQLFENGKKVWIKINDPQLAIALRGIGAEKLGPVLNAIGAFTRFYSGLATRFNPEFALPNKIRDLQETAIYLASQKDVGFKGASKAVLRDLKQENTIAVLDYLRGIDSKGARAYQEMKDLGGTTGGFGLSTKKQVKLSIENLEKLANSKTKRIANNLLEYVDNWNTIFEDSTRLSVYRQGLDQGLSKDRAAVLAKEASLNFNRKGKGGSVINALWMFSNASIQGSAKMIRSLKNPKVLGATLLTVGGATATLNQWNDNVDKDWRDKVSKWDRLNGLPIMIPSTDGGVKYITIPVSWGIKPIKVMSDYAYDAISGFDFNAKNFIEDTLTAIIDAYNPAGGTDLMSTISPTVLDIPVELARNKSWNGNKIKPDFDANAPEDIKYFDNLSETKIGEVSISISEALQKYVSISISPADIKYAYDQYVGGAGRSVSKVVNVISGVASGEPIPANEYPLISRFYKQRTEEEVDSGTMGKTEKIKELLGEQSRDRFKIQKEAEKLYEEYSKLPTEEANNKVKELKKNNPQVFEKLKDVAKDIELGLNYTERTIKQLGVTNGERAKYIWNELKDMKTADEKNAYVKDLRTKKIISDEVLKQLKQLYEMEEE